MDLVEKEKQRCIDAVNAEPEYPGEVSDKMWEAVKDDRDLMREVLRLTVELTKKGIIERIRK